MKNILKTVLITSLIVLIFAIGAYASGEDIRTPSDAEMYLDEAHANYKAVSRVVIFEDNHLLVMSHCTDKRYHIGSVPRTKWGTDGICLTDILKSDSYALSYVNADFEESETGSIKEGYIKCVGNDEEFYVPIEISTEKTELGINQKNPLAATSSVKSETAMSGKTSDDASDVIAVGDTPIGTDSGVLRIDYWLEPLKLTDATNHPYNITAKPYTLEFDVLLSGNMGINLNLCMTEFIRIDSDGYFWYDSGDSSGKSAGMKKDEKFKLERNKWYRIGFMWDAMRSRVCLYCNGKLVSNMASYLNGGMNALFGNPLGLRIGALEGSVNSYAAIDNVCGYIGYYHASSEPLTVNGDGENIIASDGSIAYNNDVITNSEALINIILQNADADSVSVTDSDFNPVNGTLPENAVCVFEKDDIYHYYPLKKFFAMNSFEFVEEEGKLGAKSVWDNASGNGKNVTMVIVTRNSEGKIDGVHTSPVANISGVGQEVSVNPVEIGDKTVYVFFIDNWESRLAYTSEPQVYEQQE